MTYQTLDVECSPAELARRYEAPERRNERLMVTEGVRAFLEKRSPEFSS